MKLRIKFTSSKSMSRNTKWKLAIVAGITKCLVYAEAKYCAFEIHGEPKYYVCPRTEYCCNFGCCVSPGFQIYHLWYYWLLVIIMFLVCSGGGWWYRYWLQGRYRAATSAIPTRSSSSRTQNPLRGPTCQAQQVRISYNTARNTVLLHRMWKAGTHRSATSPAYSGATAASSAAHYQNTSVVLNDANCPYYQLYGPPPSYETVIAQTRGKISSPSSPELLQRQGHHGRAVVPMPPPLLPPPPPTESSGFVGQCYYNVPPVPQYQPPGANPPPRIEGFDTAEYVRLVQQYGIDSSPRHQPQFTEAAAITGAYDRNSIANTCSKSSDNSDGENSQPNSPDEGGFPITRIDCAGSSCALDRPLQCYASAGKFTSRIGVHGISRRERAQFNSASSSQLELTAEPVATTSLGFDGCSSSYRPASRAELRKIQGGSLKIPRRRNFQQAGSSRQQYDATLRTSRRLSSTITADYECRPTTSSGDDLQSNPSNNVILAANATSKSAVEAGPAPVQHGDADDQRKDHHNRQQQQQQQQQRPPAPSTIAEQSSTNSNFESKRKLDRSRSLD